MSKRSVRKRRHLRPDWWAVIDEASELTTAEVERAIAAVPMKGYVGMSLEPDGRITYWRDGELVAVRAPSADWPEAGKRKWITLYEATRDDARLRAQPSRRLT